MTTGMELLMASGKTIGEVLAEKNAEIERLRQELNTALSDKWMDNSYRSRAERAEAALALYEMAAQGAATMEQFEEEISRRERAEAALATAPYEALGFAHAWCCSLLDHGQDPRTTECGVLLKKWADFRALAEKEKP